MNPDLLPAPGQIVVGVDGSESSKLALRWAARFSQALGGHIIAATAWKYPVAIGWVMPGFDPRAEAKKRLVETVEDVFGSQRPAGLQLWERDGDPAEVLIQLSSTARMLVVGSRGLGGFAGLLLGSVSSQCAEHAKCPVLVVHEPIGEVAPETFAEPATSTVSATLAPTQG